MTTNSRPQLNAGGSLSPGGTNSATSLSTNGMDALDDIYRLAIGDRVTFQIKEDDDDPQLLTVMDSGDLQVPYIGPYPVVSKTCRELARDLKAELEKNYYYQATVIITVDSKTKSRGIVYLVGAVRAPGPQDIPSDEVLTVSKAILRAGGFTDYADQHDVKITLDGNVTNSLVERYRDLANQHLGSVDKREISDNSVLLTVDTNQSRIPIAMAARSTVWRDGEPVPATYRLFDAAAEIGHDIEVRLTVGEAVTVEKIVSVYTGHDVATSEPGVDAERGLARLGRFAELLDGHLTEWAHLWERLSIEFDFTDELRILRLHLLHLLQTVSPNTADLDAGVPARGLHGEAYRGHIFWDELFIFPVLNLRLPMITRSLLGYRYRRLPEARHAATAAGYSGAMFPWQSGSDGREESQRLHLNPRSGHWNPDASARAHHIGIAVAYSAWEVQSGHRRPRVPDRLRRGDACGDRTLLRQPGDVRRRARSFWHPRGDRADEFHSGYPGAPYDGIDNNAYTNVMAVWVIMRALDALKPPPLPNRLDLLEVLGLHTAELAHWEEVSRRMYVPFHDGVISQFEGYGALEELDWDRLRRQYGNIQRLDRILEAEHDDVNRYKASKQADALMLLYLMSADRAARAPRPARLSLPARSGAGNGGLLPGSHIAWDTASAIVLRRWGITWSFRSVTPTPSKYAHPPVSH